MCINYKQELNFSELRTCYYYILWEILDASYKDMIYTLQSYS